MRFKEHLNAVTADWFEQQWQAGKAGAIAPVSVANEDAVQAYLAQECQRLATAGYIAAIAPLERNTWHRYRCIIESHGRPLFWREPALPAYWCGALQQQGFGPIANYQSAECTHLGIVDPRQRELRDRFTEQGVRLRPVHWQTPETELRRIYTVAIAAFAKNFCFTPIGFGEFRQLYEPLLPLLNREMVILAAEGEAIVGFALGIPDRLTPKGQTIILKTVAILPQRRYAGLGRLLVADFHDRAARQGYLRIIHALMHNTNASCNLSRRYAAQTFRRYALWGKVLTH